MSQDENTNKLLAGDIVTARARKLVRQMVEIIVAADPLEAMEELAAMISAATGADLELIPALIEALNSSDWHSRVIAASILPRIASDAPSLVTGKIVGRARAQLLQTLQSNDVAQLLLAVMLLGGFVTPSADLQQALLRLLHHPDRRVAVFSAIALSQDEGDNPAAAISTLWNSLKGDDALLASYAGCALLRLRLHRREVGIAFPRLFFKLTPEAQYGLLKQLPQVGLNAEALSDFVAKIVDDNSAHPVVRGAAAVALAAIVKESKSVLPHLLNAVHSSEPPVVCGAILGLDKCGQISNELTPHFVHLLGHDDPKMRCAAALGLYLLGRDAASAIPSLVAQLIKDRDFDVSEGMQRALGKMGALAVTPLVAVIGGDDIVNAELATHALARTGSDGATAIAEILATTDDDFLSNALLAALIGIGREAAPAVDVLAARLDAATDEQIAMRAIIAIGVCRAAGASAVPALIRYIARHALDDTAVIWAKQALTNLGSEAMTALEAAATDAAGIEKQRIEIALASIQPRNKSTFAKFEKLQQDDLLKSFVAVANIYLAEGRIGWRKVAEILQKQLADGEISALKRGDSNRALAYQMARLEKQLGLGDLFHHDNNVAGGLTDPGKKLLPDVIAYLEIKSANHSVS